jgi:hypothetical protein
MLRCGIILAAMRNRAYIGFEYSCVRGETMNASTFQLPLTLTHLWLENSIQVLRVTSELWGSLLNVTGARPVTSTASPWWMPPQQPRVTASAGLWPTAFAAGAWVPPWPQAMAFPPIAAAPGANPFLPWLPTERTANTFDPITLWQQMWLDATVPAVYRPAQTVSEVPVIDELWQPIAAAYRTANGHAMAAVLRTMADVVEPKPQGFAPAHYWPNTLGTRH